MKAPERRRAWRRLLGFALGRASHRRDLAQAAAAAVLSAILALLGPLLTMALIDLVAGSPSASTLGVVWTAMLGISLLSVGALLAEGYFLARFATMTAFAAQQRLFRHVLSLSVQDVDDVGKRSFQVSMSFNLIQSLADMTAGMGSRLWPELIVTATGLGILSLVNLKLALVMLAFFPLVMLPPVLIFPYVAARSRALEDAQFTESSIRQGVFQHLDRAKGMGLEGYLAKQSVSFYLKNLRDYAAFSNVVSLASKGCAGLSGLSGVVLLFLSAQELVEGRLSYGAYYAFSFYSARYVAVANQLGALLVNHLSLASEALGSMEVLSISPSIPEPPRPAPLVRGPGTIELQGVSFAYRGTSAPVLSGIDLRLEGGQRVAIVGESGTGKTTLTRLVMRHLDPTRGRVLLDGQDLREHRLRDVRACFGHVSQDLVQQTFSGTVRQNVIMSWGDRAVEKTDEDRLWRALEDACAADFVRSLPRGLETPLLDLGDGVSQGQLQRLLLARLFYAAPPVVVLDEFTSNLDTESARRVLESVQEFTRGRTTLLISHRLAAVCWADRLVYLRDGAIVEAGTHDELMAREGEYARLFRDQLPPAFAGSLAAAP